MAAGQSNTPGTHCSDRAIRLPLGVLSARYLHTTRVIDGIGDPNSQVYGSYAAQAATRTVLTAKLNNTAIRRGTSSDHATYASIEPAATVQMANSL